MLSLLFCILYIYIYIIDGTQGETISASVEDKMKICHRLAQFNVDYIEAGWPGSNPKDAAFFARILKEAEIAEQQQQEQELQQQQEAPATTGGGGEATTKTTRPMALQIRDKLTAFGSTRRKGIAVQDDEQVQALIDSQAPTICIVAKAHAKQVTDILRTTLDENLNMIHDTITYLKKQSNPLLKHSQDGTTKTRTVMVDLEHYFDGYKDNPEYAFQCCQVAVEAGASCLVLCDTNGGSMPWEIETAIVQLRQYLKTTFLKKQQEQQQQHENNNNKKEHDKEKNGTNQQQQVEDVVTLGIHCHNDCGMAVANSIMAVQVGVGLIQGTINGIGERTGNADLCTIVPNLALKLQTQISCQNQLSHITQLSHYVDEILNRTPNTAAPYVGTSAFAHKGGLHVAAMKRSPNSYQHTNPIQVGNLSRVLISELSGQQNILGKVEALMKKGHISSSSSSMDVMEQVKNDDKDKEEEKDNKDALLASKRATAILQRVKQLELKGYTFEGAEASVDLMILHASQGYCPPFQVLDYSAQVYDSRLDSTSRFLQYDDDDENCCMTMKNGLGPTARATVKVRTIETRDHHHKELDDHYYKQQQDKDNDDKNNNNNKEEQSMIHERLEVCDGSGPVDALAKALMRALQPVHPSLAMVELMDYKVRILDPELATSAATRVMIEFRDTAKEIAWTTVSVDTNVISASLNALIDGFEYALIDYAQDNCLLREI